MKTSHHFILALIAVLCLTALTTSAKIWRVNNRAGIATDFTTAQAAHDGASAGDTIFLEPSPDTYGNITLTKKLIIIGTGYFLDQNPETQWKQNWPSTLGAVTFADSPTPNCEHSQLTGVNCTDILIVHAPNITINRNYFHYRIELLNSNINFFENYCYSPGQGYNSRMLLVTGPIHNIMINNNIFHIEGDNWAPEGNIVASVAYNGIFKNNLILGFYGGNYRYCSLDIDNFSIQNNIMEQCVFYPNNSTYSYNIADNDAFGNQNGNQQNVDLSTVFLYTGSTDGQYQLKAGSPAIGAGSGGVDCGAFGGPNPYVLSGLPPVPAIYDFMIGNQNNQYNVNLKIKSHN